MSGKAAHIAVGLSENDITDFRVDGKLMLRCWWEAVGGVADRDRIKALRMLMKSVCIGVQVYAEPDRLRATIDSVRLHTPPGFEMVLLPDGPDRPTQVLLATLSELPQAGTVEPRGGAACLNRLAAYNDAQVIVLLESGCLVAPGWLDHLLAALDADPRHGLAGPSTNRAWNEQGVFPQGGGTAEAVAQCAREAAQRFGSQTRTLEPLYSLADFCYAVRREVIDRIGAADEIYDLGPCWEMDYNLRAARAGWLGVWAGAAFVWRAPFTMRRRVEEGRRLESSKRFYQDKFCGARLRGEKRDYRAHCRGDSCPNFAPGALIQIHHPGQPRSPLTTSTATGPLVSCIMPTGNRRRFVPQAIRCFLRQDYPNLELVVMDDGAEPMTDYIPEDERIRYFRLDHQLTIGAKRNLACASARGELIVHWDDDDWYPEGRVRRQIGAMLERGADICGSSRIYYFDPHLDRAWEYQYGDAGRRAWVAGNTLAYRRSFWEQHPFLDIQVGEDARFVWSAARHQICDLSDPALCVATIHAGNTSRKETGGSLWQTRPIEYLRSLLGDDLYFYRVDHFSSPAPEWPLVSCIMPTWNRRRFVPLALQSFLRQDYPNRELIIIDDGDDPVGDLADQVPGVRYFRLPARTSIGAKRNLACERAAGRIIAHWDDDDWYSSDRLRYQAAPILAGEADLTGLENAFVMQLPAGDYWTTRSDLRQRMFVGDVCGGTLVYRRELLDRGLQYPEADLAEDAWLLLRAMRKGYRLRRLANPGVFVYVRHEGNSWQFTPGDFLNPDGWTRIAPPSLFLSGQLASYQAASVTVFSEEP
jgi:O-antigen biosynthesis protein